MKIATYNIQNIFSRHVDLLDLNFRKKCVIWQEEFEALRLKEKRKDADFQRMRELAKQLELGSTNSRSYSMDNASHEYHKTIRNGNRVHISEDALNHKIQVVSEIDPDILLLQEVESRAALLKFNELIFKDRPESAYREFIHLDGNIGRGLGMGIMLKDGYRIRAIKSYSSVKDEDKNFLFSNDLQSYKIENPIGQIIYILNVQLSSDNEIESSEYERIRQAKMVSEVYENLRCDGNDDIIVLGTFNAPKYSSSISPIFETDMINISELSSFHVESDLGFDKGYYRLGAFKKGVNIEQCDYILTSPELKNRIYRSGMNRKAIWPLTRPQWSTYDSLLNERDSASEHPLLWTKLNLEKSSGYLKKSA